MPARPITPEQATYRERIVVQMRSDRHTYRAIAERLQVDSRVIAGIIRRAVDDGRLPLEALRISRNK
jgi:DNA-binding CsgD family transcriptional regulator